MISIQNIDNLLTLIFYVTPIRQGGGVSRIGYISDTDTHRIRGGHVSMEYRQKNKQNKIPIRGRYVSNPANVQPGLRIRPATNRVEAVQHEGEQKESPVRARLLASSRARVGRRTAVDSGSAAAD